MLVVVIVVRVVPVTVVQVVDVTVVLDLLVAAVVAVDVVGVLVNLVIAHGPTAGQLMHVLQYMHGYRTAARAQAPRTRRRDYPAAGSKTNTGMWREVLVWYSAYGGKAATASSHQCSRSAPSISRATISVTVSPSWTVTRG